MNKTVKIILSILAVILISGMVFWSVKNRNEGKQKEAEKISNENQNNEQKQQQDIQKPEDEIESIRDLIDGEYQFGNINTSKWQTYQNEEMGFEVKIPRNWYASRGYADREICLREKGKDYSIEGLSGMCGISISVSERYSEKKTNFRKYVKEGRKESYPGTQVLSLKIDNVEGIFMDSFFGLETIFFRDTKEWDINSIANLDYYKEVAKTYPGVLKTFKFLK